MKQLLIIGAGGTGQDVAGFISDINDEGPTYNCLGFLDDDDSKPCSSAHLAPLRRVDLKHLIRLIHPRCSDAGTATAQPFHGTAPLSRLSRLSRP